MRLIFVLLQQRRDDSCRYLGAFQRRDDFARVTASAAQDGDLGQRAPPVEPRADRLNDSFEFSVFVERRRQANYLGASPSCRYQWLALRRRDVAHSEAGGRFQYRRS